MTADSCDKNPGTFNAYQYGGFLCGTLTLCGDLLKGFLPVFLYHGGSVSAADAGLAFVMAAPVYGHVLPVFHKLQGGKGIAVSFGCLLGLLPEARPVSCAGCCVFVFFFGCENHPKLSPYLFYLFGFCCRDGAACSESGNMPWFCAGDGFGDSQISVKFRKKRIV